MPLPPTTEARGVGPLVLVKTLAIEGAEGGGCVGSHAVLCGQAKESPRTRRLCFAVKLRAPGAHPRRGILRRTRTNTSTVSMGLPASNDGCGALKPRAAEPSAVSPSLSGRLSDPSDARPGQNSLISQDECACSPPPLIRPTCFYGSEESGRRRGMWERGSAEAAAEPIATVGSRCGQLAA